MTSTYDLCVGWNFDGAQSCGHNVNGFQLEYGPDDNPGSDAVFLSVIGGRRVVIVGLRGTAKELMTALNDVSAVHAVSEMDDAKAAIRSGAI